MSTSKSCSSGKRKAYGDVTTKRLYESFKENNYPNCDSKEKFEQSGGWIKELPEEVENERMHLMTMVELVQPKWYERVVGHLEEKAIHPYTLYLNDIDRGEIENVLAPAIAIDYWRLPKDATLKDVDEAYHRDVNHFASPWETYQADLLIDLSKHHVPKKFLDKVAYCSPVLNGFVKSQPFSQSSPQLSAISIERAIATEPPNRGVFNVLSKGERVVSNGLDYILGRLIRESTEIPAPINEVYL
ncbi:Ubiquinol oxidase 2, mitochondrial [Capsicum baccatum]|uniref:Ubiquinol oxidase n=1 Tax=Capsicum baccatum TaxID=33114 RepID=A0A2G2X5H7_CAPBA|nr:Ubiquinol oxidase 2, mitochondrial [Capsicum baccatum]